jgi:predicted nucleotidyltransferase
MLDIEKIEKDIIERLKPLKPEKIILFGSYAAGRATDDSDIDMLVIMPFDGSAIDKSAEMRLSLSSKYSIDLLVRTPQQIKQRLELGDCFYQEILDKGKVLYEAVN